MAEIKFPQTYRHENGAELTAMNEQQAGLYEREGFKLVKEDTKKKPASN